MADSKIGKLVRALLEKTKAGKVSWEKTINETVFQAVFAGYVVRLFRVGDQPADDIGFIILNDREETIEETTTHDVSVDRRACRELFELARRQALGADRAIDDLLKQLAYDSPGGLPPIRPPQM